MVSLLLHLNAKGEVPLTEHPDHLLFQDRFMQYHPEKKRNVCFLDGRLAPAVSPTHLRCVHCSEVTAAERIQAEQDAEGRLFALVHPRRTKDWLPRADYLYITHTLGKDPHGFPLGETIEEHFVKLGQWSWGDASTRTVWVRSRFAARRSSPAPSEESPHV